MAEELSRQSPCAPLTVPYQVHPRYLVKDRDAVMDKRNSERECRWCGQRFIPAGPEARFCSGACRPAAYRDRREPGLTDPMTEPCVAEGGEVVQRVELRENRASFALIIGGLGRRSLFIMTAEWRKADGITNNLQRLASGARMGEILALPVSVPGTGRP